VHPVHVDLAVEDPEEDDLERTRSVGRAPGRGEGDGAAPGVHVGGRAQIRALDDLRGQVTGRADERAGLGQLGPVHGVRDAEVDDDRLAVGDDHVAGLEVAVDHLHRVDVLDRPGHTGDEAGQSAAA
jgi:hypothetical protein